MGNIIPADGNDLEEEAEQSIPEQNLGVQAQSSLGKGEEEQRSRGHSV